MNADIFVIASAVKVEINGCEGRFIINSRNIYITIDMLLESNIPRTLKEINNIALEGER